MADSVQLITIRGGELITIHCLQKSEKRGRKEARETHPDRSKWTRAKVREPQPMHLYSEESHIRVNRGYSQVSIDRVVAA